MMKKRGGGGEFEDNAAHVFSHTSIHQFVSPVNACMYIYMYIVYVCVSADDNGALACAQGQ